ncbi:DUF4174 domain-containing protein [Roseibacillus persicicus]|uniref:DUF4174 domain-containing protein n=1 Tax=Roseibacillus persicicus TaxID=454148 RepID=A0A918TJJ3_9BACT|nr:DUF4174 domain-containing protein [Roseibacillus persicicus]GHC48630.1 hypothetical protein GCM10007100_13180 [Roseibacillus persicicus]
MKALFASLLAMTLTLPANPLKNYQWKNRILLIHPSADQAQKEALRQLLKKEKESLANRDLVIINLSKTALDWPQVISMPGEKREELREKFALSPEGSTFILIGKDGGEKARQSDTLNLQELFTRIDGMPMRKAEMKVAK